ncbi:MAG: hypothetical protein WD273_11480, partial [Trueperaceae bacterium]
MNLWIHPDLPSFQAATGAPYYVAAVAGRADGSIHLQRLLVLRERGALEATLRHELFHLAQTSDWERWEAEGAAMIFAGEAPLAAPFEGLSTERLDSLLAQPGDLGTLRRAEATAYWLVLSGSRLEATPASPRRLGRTAPGP